MKEEKNEKKERIELPASSDTNIDAGVLAVEPQKGALPEGDKWDRLHTRRPLYRPDMPLIERLSRWDWGAKGDEQQSHNQEKLHREAQLQYPLPDAGEPSTVKTLGEGVNVAMKQVGLSWEYLLKNAQKLFVDDDRKRELDIELDAISDTYDSLPQPQGWAQVGSVGTNIVGGVLPGLIAAYVAGPVTTGIVAGSAIVNDVGTTIAHANLEMDSHEKRTGKKISPQERAAYTTSSVATDMIMNVLFSARAIKGISPSVKKEIASQLQSAILKNPTAQQEFNTMTRHVLYNERRRWPAMMKNHMKHSAIEAGVSAGVHEVSKGIYTHQAPELEHIVNSVATGAALGTAYGASASALKMDKLRRQRTDADHIFYGSAMSGTMEEGLPMSEIRPLRIVDANDGSPVQVEAVTVSPHEYGKTNLYDVGSISTGSYRKAQEDGATSPRANNFRLDRQRAEVYANEWNRALQLMEEDKEEAYAIQNEVVQRIAADLGLPIKVYAEVDDVPRELNAGNQLDNYEGFTVENATPILILENCRNLSPYQLARTIRHETLGHYGMAQPYRSREDFENHFFEAYNEGVGQLGEGTKYDNTNAAHNQLLNKGEEEAARIIESLLQRREASEKAQGVYDIMRRADRSMRNTTMSEMRSRFVDWGNTMPDLYEIEQGNRYRKRQ